MKKNEPLDILKELSESRRLLRTIDRRRISVAGLSMETSASGVIPSPSTWFKTDLKDPDQMKAMKLSPIEKAPIYALRNPRIGGGGSR
jgi:hypothetical protein